METLQPFFTLLNYIWFWHNMYVCHSQLMYEQKAVIIQKWVKGWLIRRRYRRTLAAIVLLQSCVRRLRAKKELKKLKVEARSVERIKKLNSGMENKIMQLQHKINEQVSSDCVGV